MYIYWIIYNKQDYENSKFAENQANFNTMFKLVGL